MPKLAGAPSTVQEIYSADTGQRQALTRPQPTLPPFNPRPLVSPPLSLFVPGPLTLLTALNPRGGGPEADDQAKPANGAASAPDPGSILQAKHRRRGITEIKFSKTSSFLSGAGQ